MLPEVRRILDQVEEVLLRGGQEGQDLADILSSLRGDDRNSYSDANKTKSTMTMPLRSMIFPRLYQASQQYNSATNSRSNLQGYFPTDLACWGLRNPEDFVSPTRYTHAHFEKHILRAHGAVKRTREYPKS